MECVITNFKLEVEKKSNEKQSDLCFALSISGLKKKETRKKNETHTHTIKKQIRKKKKKLKKGKKRNSGWKNSKIGEEDNYIWA